MSELHISKTALIRLTKSQVQTAILDYLAANAVYPTESRSFIQTSNIQDVSDNDSLISVTWLE